MKGKIQLYDNTLYAYCRNKIESPNKTIMVKRGEVTKIAAVTVDYVEDLFPNIKSEPLNNLLNAFEYGNYVVLPQTNEQNTSAFTHLCVGLSQFYEDRLSVAVNQNRFTNELIDQALKNGGNINDMYENTIYCSDKEDENCGNCDRCSFIRDYLVSLGYVKKQKQYGDDLKALKNEIPAIAKTLKKKFEDAAEVKTTTEDDSEVVSG